MQTVNEMFRENRKEVKKRNFVSEKAGRLLEEKRRLELVRSQSVEKEYKKVKRKLARRVNADREMVEKQGSRA